MRELGHVVGPGWVRLMGLPALGLVATLGLVGCGGSAQFPAPPSLPPTFTVPQTVVLTPEQRLALAAVLTTTDVAAEFDGSGGQPRLVSPAQVLVPVPAGSASAAAFHAQCDPDGRLEGAPAASASAQSTEFEAASPLEVADSASLVYATAPTAADVFTSLSAALPCIDQLAIGPAATGGERTAVYSETPPPIGDQAVAVKLIATAAAGTIGAGEDEIMVRVGRTLMLFYFTDTPPTTEHSMLASVIDRVSPT